MDGKAPNANARALFLAKAAKDQEGTEGLTNDGRKSYTGHIKLQENDKDEVQHHIRHATNDEEEKAAAPYHQWRAALPSHSYRP